MGFLRKVGKKIKKGVKKLFGSKFGKILGGIGLAMMFWGGANAMFGNTKWFQGLKTNISKMNPFAKPDLTSAVSEVATQPGALESTLSKVGTDAAVQGSKVIADPTKFEKFLAGDLSKVEALDTAKFADLDTVGKISKLGVEAGKGAYKAGEAVGSFLTPSGEFGADVAKGTLTALAVSAAQGTPVDEGGYGAVQPTIGGEPAQAMLMAEVKNQIPTVSGTNFLDLHKEAFYGTLHPNFLAQFGQV